MKILAIDDQKLVLIPLESRLAELGYKVLTETNALKGMELYDTFQPDSVIVDMNMPTVSGMEIVKHIRRDKKHTNPVMVLSGNTYDTSLHKNLRIFLHSSSYFFKICVADVATKYKAIES
jgi:DNA-binding response OmpR family regulator